MSFESELAAVIAHREVNREESRAMARELVDRWPERFSDLEGMPAHVFGPLTTAQRDAGNQQGVDRLTVWVMVQFSSRSIVGYMSNDPNRVPPAYIEALQDLELDPTRR